MATVYTKTASEVFAPTTGGGAARGAVMGEASTWGTELETAISTIEGQIGTLPTGAFDITGSGSKVGIDGTDNNIHIGDNVRPTPAAGAGILFGTGTTAVGSDILTSASNSATYSTFMGDGTAGGANALYCCEGFGIRVFNELVDGQYVAGFGTDAGFHLAYGRNSAMVGAKAGLYKVDIRDSFIGGAGAAYAGGDVLSSVILGANACDGGQPASFAVADADHHDVSYSIVIGAYAGRFLTGSYNVLLGNNAGSLTDITGGFNLGIGRSSFSALTSGIGNVAIGDSAGGVLSTGNYNVFIGFQVDMPGGGAAYSNCVALGYQSGASLTGSNQVQLGSTSHTVYAQSALSVRSDERDKIHEGDVDYDTASAIVLGATWVKYREDPRERYMDYEEREIEVDDYEVTEIPTGKMDSHGKPILRSVRTPIKRKEIERKEVWREKDGSRAGKRHHAGVYAQKEYARLQAEGIDFVGIKHAAYGDNGGADVWSLQYEQYIPHMGVILQRHAQQIQSLENRISQLEAA